MLPVLLALGGANARDTIPVRCHMLPHMHARLCAARGLTLRLSGGSDRDADGDGNNEDSGVSISFSEAEGPLLPNPARDGPPPTKSFLKVADDGEIWVEKEGQARECDDAFDDGTGARKVVEEIDLGVDVECTCHYCTGSGDGDAAGCERKAQDGDADANQELDLPPHLQRELDMNLQALCQDFADRSTDASISKHGHAPGVQAHTENNVQETNAPSKPASSTRRSKPHAGSAQDASVHVKAVAHGAHKYEDHDDGFTSADRGWQFKGEWQGGGRAAVTAQGAPNALGGSKREMEWEDVHQDDVHEEHMHEEHVHQQHVHQSLVTHHPSSPLPPHGRVQSGVGGEGSADAQSRCAGAQSTTGISGHDAAVLHDMEAVDEAGVLEDREEEVLHDMEAVDEAGEEEVLHDMEPLEPNPADLAALASAVEALGLEHPTQHPLHHPTDTPHHSALETPGLFLQTHLFLQTRLSQSCVSVCLCVCVSVVVNMGVGVGVCVRVGVGVGVGVSVGVGVGVVCGKREREREREKEREREDRTKKGKRERREREKDRQTERKNE